MNRNYFLFITIVPTVISAFIWKYMINSGYDKWIVIGFFLAICLYNNIMQVLRMKYIGYDLKKIIKALIPIYGFKEFIKIFYNDKAFAR